MKITRAAAALVVLAIAATLVFLYGVPSGRRARRGMLRAVRMARNATGIYPLPALTVKMWDGNPQESLLIEVYESGRVVVLKPGKRIERQLARADTERIMDSGKAALGDFSSQGCGEKPGGLNSELYVLIDGARAGSVCRDAAGPPGGVETKRLLAEIESHIAGIFAGF